MIADPRRGEIWWVDFSPGRRSEQSGRRPAIIIQVDAANRNPRYPNTIVLTISGKGREVPLHIPLAPSSLNGLTIPSFVHCEQIMMISKERLETRIGKVTAEDMEQIERGIRLVVGI